MEAKAEVEWLKGQEVELEKVRKQLAKMEDYKALASAKRKRDRGASSEESDVIARIDDNNGKIVLVQADVKIFDDERNKSNRRKVSGQS